MSLHGAGLRASQVQFQANDSSGNRQNLNTRPCELVHRERIFPRRGHWHADGQFLRLKTSNLQKMFHVVYHE